MAQEWLDRALALQPNDPYALGAQLRLFLLQLRSHELETAFPTLRETDNVVAKRRAVEVLVDKALQAQDDIGNWQAMAKAALRVANMLADEQTTALAEAMVALYDRRQVLLEELLARVQAYGASLSGVFFPPSCLRNCKRRFAPSTSKRRKRAVAARGR